MIIKAIIKGKERELYGDPKRDNLWFVYRAKDTLEVRIYRGLTLSQWEEVNQE